MTIFKNNRYRARLTALAVACALTWGAAPAQAQQQAQAAQQTTITPATSPPSDAAFERTASEPFWSSPPWCSRKTRVLI